MRSDSSKTAITAITGSLVLRLELLQVTSTSVPGVDAADSRSCIEGETRRRQKEKRPFDMWREVPDSVWQNQCKADVRWNEEL